MAPLRNCYSVIAAKRAVFKFLPVLLAVLWPYNSVCASDWIGTPLSKLTGTSELIVYGSVKEVLDSTVAFEVAQRIGNEEADVIEVLKAKPDPFAGVKPAPYQSGQYYLLFLAKSPSAGPKVIWKVMGKGQEAQMPVIDNYVYFNDRYLEGIPLKQYKVNGVELNIQRFEFASFVNALEDYKKCYQWIRQGQDDKYLVKQLCNDDEVTLYSKKSFIHNYLVTETQAFVTNK
jgi:hypothetical protein